MYTAAKLKTRKIILGSLWNGLLTLKMYILFYANKNIDDQDFFLIFINLNFDV